MCACLLISMLKFPWLRLPALQPEGDQPPAPGAFRVPEKRVERVTAA